MAEITITVTVKDEPGGGVQVGLMPCRRPKG